MNKKKMWNKIKDIASAGSVITFVTSPYLIGELVMAIGRAFPKIDGIVGIIAWTVLWAGFTVSFAIIITKSHREKK